MKTINKHEYETLKKESDSLHGGYDVAEFKVNVFSTEYGVSGEKKETMTFKGEVFKNSDDTELFVCYDPFHDGTPQFHTYKKEDLASPEVNVLEHTSIENEQNKEIARDLERMEKNRIMEEERRAESRRNFKIAEEKRKEQKEAEAMIKRKTLEDKKEAFIEEHGFMLEITDINEDKGTLYAKMVDKKGDTLATFDYEKMISMEEIEPSEGFEIDENEVVYGLVPDEDYLTIRDKKGNEIEDSGAVYVAKEAIESLKIWSKDDLACVRDTDHPLENPESNISFEEKDSDNVLKTLERVAKSSLVQKIAQNRAETPTETGKRKPKF